MAKVILICGKICCGKSTYAEQLCAENSAVTKGKVNAYIADDNLAAKLEAMFEMPDKEEIDIWVMIVAVR